MTATALAEVAEVNEPVRSAPRRGLAAWDCAQAVLALVGLALCLRGASGAPSWALLALFLPALRFLLAPAYRKYLVHRLGQFLSELEAYPVRDRRIPWRATFVCVLAPAAALLLSKEFAIVSGDAAPVILTAARLTTAGDLDLSEYLDIYTEKRLFTSGDAPPYFFRRTAGGAYSAYPSGMVPFALPTTVVARLLGANLRTPDVLGRLDHWTAVWVAAACLGLFFLLALHLAPLRPAWVVTLMLAVGSVMFSIVGQTLWQHGGVLFWGLIALLVEFRREPRLSLGGAALEGIAFAMMLACRLSAALFIVPFVVWVFFRSPRQALSMTCFACAAFLPWAGLYGALYGSPFGPALDQGGSANWTVAGLWEGLAGVLISPSHGLLVYQPWLLLAGLVWVPAVRRALLGMSRVSCPRGWTIFAGCFMFLHLFLIGAWRCWWGGDCWGSRLAAEVVPLGALLCVRPVVVLWATTFGRRLVWAAVVVGCLLHVPAVHFKECDWNWVVQSGGQQEKLWSWSDPPFAYALLHWRFVRVR